VADVDSFPVAKVRTGPKSGGPTLDAWWPAGGPRARGGGSGHAARGPAGCGGDDRGRRAGGDTGGRDTGPTDPGHGAVPRGRFRHAAAGRPGVPGPVPVPVRLGADESYRYFPGHEDWPIEPNLPQTITVHHTGFATGADPAETVRSIYRRQALPASLGGEQGWGDIGYHLLIDADGVVYEGRYSGSDQWPVFDPIGWYVVTGAHVYGYNTGNIGVCLLGYLNDQSWTSRSPCGRTSPTPRKTPDRRPTRRSRRSRRSRTPARIPRTPRDPSRRIVAPTSAGRPAPGIRPEPYPVAAAPAVAKAEHASTPEILRGARSCSSISVRSRARAGGCGRGRGPPPAPAPSASPRPATRS